MNIDATIYNAEILPFPQPIFTLAQIYKYHILHKNYTFHIDMPACLRLSMPTKITKNTEMAMLSNFMFYH